jgi:hypothetical protein
LAPSGHPPRFLYTWRSLIGASHAIRRPQPLAPQVSSHAAAVQLQFHHVAAPHRRPSPTPPRHAPSSFVDAWCTEPSHHTVHLFSREPRFPEKEKIERGKEKEKKERKFQTLFSQNRSGGLSTLIESKPLRHGIPVEPLVEPPTLLPGLASMR